MKSIITIVLLLTLSLVNAQKIGMFFDGKYIPNGSVVNEVPRLIELKVKGNTYEVSSFELVISEGKWPRYTDVIDSNSICTFGFMYKFRLGGIPRLAITVKTIKHNQTGALLKLKNVFYVTFSPSPEFSFDEKCDFTFNNSITTTRNYKRYGLKVDYLESVQVYREDTTLIKPIKIYLRVSNAYKDSLRYNSVTAFEQNFITDLKTQMKDKMRNGDRLIITNLPNCYEVYETGYKYIISEEEF